MNELAAFTIVHFDSLVLVVPTWKNNKEENAISLTWKMERIKKALHEDKEGSFRMFVFLIQTYIGQ